MDDREVFLKRRSMRSSLEKKKREVIEITKCDSSWKKQNHRRCNAGGTKEHF